jgi:hypothetical protein
MDDGRDDDTANALMVVPLMWASKMMRANMEFIAELQVMGLPLDDIVNNLRDRKHN